MTDGWANSTDTTPANGDGSIRNDPVERDSYKDRSTTPPGHNIRRSRSPEGNRGDTNPGTNLHVSGLNLRVTDRMLEDMFSTYGKVEKAHVVYDPHTRESRGFGFVMMSTLDEAEAAISGLNGRVLEGKALHIDKARRGRARTPTPGSYRGFKRERDERPYAPRQYYNRYSDVDDDRYYRRGEYSRGYRDYDRGYDDYGRQEERYGGRWGRYSPRSEYEYDRYYNGRERGRSSRYQDDRYYYSSRR